MYDNLLTFVSFSVIFIYLAKPFSCDIFTETKQSNQRMQCVMKNKRKNTDRFLACCLALVMCWGTLGCATTKKTAKKEDVEVKSQKRVSISEPPRRLLSTYKGMRQDDTVSWVWYKLGFSLKNCTNVKLYPLQNFSRVHHPWAEKKMTEALQELFGPVAGGENAQIGIRAAIVDMKVKPGILKKYFPGIDDLPSIECELVIFEEKTEKPLFKLIHYKKNKEFEPAFEELLDDLKNFFKSNLPARS